MSSSKRRPSPSTSLQLSSAQLSSVQFSSVQFSSVQSSQLSRKVSQRWLWRMPSSGMCGCIDPVWTDVSEKCIASLFRVEKSASVEPAWAGVCSNLNIPVPRSRIFVPWRWKRYVPPKRRFTQDLHNATPQKTAFVIHSLPHTSSWRSAYFVKHRDKFTF
jgi:hypothetical protein